MKVIVSASVSSGTPWWPEVVRENRNEYCERHGYRMVELEREYADALADADAVCELLDQCDLLWTLDADCLITDMWRRIEEIDGFGPHVTLCREGVLPHVPINAGSVVWRNTPESRELAKEVGWHRDEWAGLKHYSQDWLAANLERLADRLAVVPERTFNSAWPIWQRGDFVFHACGQPADKRTQMLRERLGDVVR